MLAFLCLQRPMLGINLVVRVEAEIKEPAGKLEHMAAYTITCPSVYASYDVQK